MTANRASLTTTSPPESYLNLRKIADGNIQDAADICYVSPSTISRFVKKLRFENYNSFKYKLSSDLYFPRSITSPIPTSNISGSEAPVDHYFELLSAHINSLSEMLTPEVLDTICDMMHRAESIVIFSHSDLTFRSFQVGMATTNKLIHHLTNDQSMTEQIPSFNSGTLVFTPLYPTSNAKQKILLCKERGASVIAICREKKFIFNDLADISLAIDAVSSEFNEYLIRFLFDTILLNYRHKYSR